MDAVIENLFVGREVYSTIFGSLCEKYQLTLTEVIVLLFFANNKEFDTARDVVEKLKITKSHVSASIHDLERCGYLTGRYVEHDHKTRHLQVCPSAMEIVQEARQAQQDFWSIVYKEFSDEEKNTLRDYLQRMTKNCNEYLRSC